MHFALSSYGVIKGCLALPVSPLEELQHVMSINASVLSLKLLAASARLCCCVEETIPASSLPVSYSGHLKNVGYCARDVVKSVARRVVTPLQHH